MESAVGSLYVREAFPRDSKDSVGALRWHCPWPLPAGSQPPPHRDPTGHWQRVCAQGHWGAHVCPAPRHMGRPEAPPPALQACLGKGTGPTGCEFRGGQALGPPRRRTSSQDPGPAPAGPQCWHAGQGPCAPQVRKLIDKVRAVFVETLDELGWMDEASKKKAQEKVRGWPEPRGQGVLPREGSPSRGAQGGRHHTPSETRTPRLGVACRNRAVGRGGTRSQVWETPWHLGASGSERGRPQLRPQSRAPQGLVSSGDCTTPPNPRPPDLWLAVGWESGLGLSWSTSVPVKPPHSLQGGPSPSPPTHTAASRGQGASPGGAVTDRSQCPTRP